LAIKLKSNYRLLVIWILGMYLTSIALMSAVDVSERLQFLQKDYYFQSSAFTEQLYTWQSLVRTYHFDARKGAKDEEQRIEYARHALALRDESIRYYFVNTHTGQTYSNLEGAPDLGLLKEYSLHSRTFPNSSDALGPLSLLNRYTVQNGLTGVLYVPKETAGFSQVHKDYTYYMGIRERMIKESLLLIVSAVGAMTSFIYLRKSAYVDPVRAYLHQMPVWNRLPLDVKAVCLFFLVLGAIAFIGEVSIFHTPIEFEHAFALTILSILLSVLLPCIGRAYALMRRPADWAGYWQASFSYSLYRLTSESLLNKSVLFKVLLFMASTMLFGLSLLILLSDPQSEEPFVFSLIFALFYVMVIVPMLLRRIITFNRIIRATEEIAAGHLDFSIPADGRGNLAGLARNLNNLKVGLSKSIESHMKSERMKSELITNVSHDLKTPLTSIINYVDLLKKEDLTPEEKQQYVEILDRKAQRLKVLIDDLFEAAKMSSGDVELVLEQADVAALLEQAMAELAERIEESGLAFRIHVEKPKMYALIDGRKMWRVFENVISNALKYAIPGTRVYIHLTEKDDLVIFSIQNISAYEIDFEAEELFERFKRGDQSRHTEGSGLGLAIAKSIIDLHGGKLRIEIDGDQFKVIIELNKGA
jgi:signal transduction histidine kinase